ncbi:hypothetical protein MBLNU230_g7046t1 [Neophaeotheca triangularis]
MLLSKCFRQAAPHQPPNILRSLTTTSPFFKHQNLPPRPTVSEDSITESFLKGTGPGGQKINKTSSAVQLKHLPTGLVVKSQETRSRSQNRKIARQVLAERLEVLEKGEGSRTALKAERAKGKKASAIKKSRRKYRKLAEGKEGEGAEEGEEDGEQGQGAEADAEASSDERSAAGETGKVSEPKEAPTPRSERDPP